MITIRITYIRIKNNQKQKQKKLKKKTFINYCFQNFLFQLTFHRQVRQIRERRELLHFSNQCNVIVG